MNPNLTLNELEQAINYWRNRNPSTGEESALSAEVNALASVYALMIFHKQNATTLPDLSPRVQTLVQTWQASLAPNPV
ncbi:MAG: hypothetical protein RL748_490 [Pseudomonadota bacterium]|jgi:hypothetical protein